MSRQAPRHIARTIGLNIRAARLAAGLTQHQLAQSVGTEGFQVSRWERGRHRPDDERLIALGEALGVPFVDFYIEADQEAA